MNRVRANWCKGKFEVNYLTPIGGRQIDFQPVEPSNDNWMVFKSKHESVTYLMLWNCEQQRMWAAHGVLDHVLSPVFVNEGTSYVPPLVAVGINARDRIVLFRDQEHISLKIHLPSVGSNGLEHIHCCVNNKLYNSKSLCPYDFSSKIVLYVDDALINSLLSLWLRGYQHRRFHRVFRVVGISNSSKERLQRTDLVRQDKDEILRTAGH